VSCYDDVELAIAAEAAGADYVAIGSMFASPTKPAATRASLELGARGSIRIETLPAMPVADLIGMLKE